MEAFAGFISHLSEALEADRRVYEITENEASRIWFATKKKRGSFIKKRLGKFRIALDTFNNGLLEIMGQSHAFFPFLLVPITLTLYIKVSFCIK